jgi:hypothetical protein
MKTLILVLMVTGLTSGAAVAGDLSSTDRLILSDAEAAVDGAIGLSHDDAGIPHDHSVEAKYSKYFTRLNDGEEGGESPRDLEYGSDHHIAVCSTVAQDSQSGKIYVGCCAPDLKNKKQDRHYVVYFFPDESSRNGISPGVDYLGSGHAKLDFYQKNLGLIEAEVLKLYYPELGKSKLAEDTCDLRLR